MPGKKYVATQKDIAYIYDGSLPGLFSCVFESVALREIPVSVQAEAEAQPTLFPEKFIETDHGKAARVQKSIPEKISPRAAELVEKTFLSCLPEKSLAILRFLHLGYQEGFRTPWMMGHEDVAPLMEAEKHIMGESHLLKGFIRFADYDGVLAATITPKNFILPYLVDHFVSRYSEEEFMIFDKNHKAALVYQDKRARIIPLESIEFPPADETEQGYQALWKQFYKTIAIEARTNHACRRTHMPKRYWPNMVEMQEYL